MQLASYAKINLFLEVLAKLPTDYHKIETLLCSVSLCDTIKYALTKKPEIKLWSNLPEMATDSNLVFKAASYLQGKFNPEKGIEIYLDKKIPIAAGLGGGSSNAANTILALNSLWGLDLSVSEMEDIASLLGSDVSFFLHGGTAWATNLGEQVKQCEDINIGNMLLVNPNIAISSSSAYGLVNVPDEGNRRFFDFVDWKTTCFNRLEPGIRDTYENVDSIISQLHNFGASPAMMSGSGSTCFGVFESSHELEACKRSFDESGYWTNAVRTISRNEYQNVFKT